MNNFTYENQGTNTYLVYKVAEGENTDSFCLGMIANNHIPGLAPTVFVQMDNTKYIKYNVTAKVSVSQFFTGPVNKKRLIGVFDGIVDAMLSAEEYMIEQEMIILDLDYIFTDVSTCKTDLICLPVTEIKRNEIDFRSFFKNIMFSTQFDQTENCDYVAKLMNYLNSTPSFSLNDFKNVLEDASGISNTAGGVSQSVAQNMTATQTNITSQPVTPQPVVSKTVSAQPVAPQPVVPQPVTPQSVTPQPAPVQPVVPQPAAPQTAGGINIPGMKPAVTNTDASSDEKPMSKMYLLQHYSKENKAIYDAQQAAKKNKDTQPQVAASSPNMPVTAQNNTPATTDEKPMTMMYLLQHYSKENKAIYDAQQAAKKRAPAPASGNAPQQTPKNTPFAIPGQAAQPVSPETSPVRPRTPVQPQPAVKPQPAVQPQPAVKPQPAVQPQPVTPIPSAPQPAVQPRPAGQFSMNFGETTVLGGGGIGETTVLNAVSVAEKKPEPFLIRSRNNERIPINKPVFRIGKEKSYVDYFIGDNTTISRSHANIIVREDKYFIVDTNSTNHTYVNGQMIPSNAEIEICHGTRIRLANEDFEFQLV